MKLSVKRIVVAALFVAGIFALKLHATAPNKIEPQTWSPGCIANVPRSWGVFRGGSAQSGLAFEDSTGTLRFLTNIPCDGTPTVALEIHRTADKNPNNN